MRLASLVAPLILASVGLAQGWQRVQPDLELAFPRDHGAHPDYRIEWWYFTGQLVSPEGRRFGFQFTVFRSGMGDSPGAHAASPLRATQVLAGQLAITDVEGDRTRFAERLRRTGSPLASSSGSDLDIVLDDWSLRRTEGDRLVVEAGDLEAGIALELELEPTKPLVLHGGNGYSSKGRDPGNASAYVSWTRLATTGRLEIEGLPVEVSGEAWFDHEFGTSVLEDGLVGWDWFGLQLDDGRELMLFRLRADGGAGLPVSAATLVEPDGSARSIDPRGLRIEPLETWTSATSGATYPARWKLSIDSEGLVLDVAPIVADCEVGGAGGVGVTYWEGPVVVSGGASGRGYAELTGYAGTMEGRL